MDFSVLTTGINACVVLATTMTGLVIGTPVSFSWNGVKVTVGNSGEEQSKTDEVSKKRFKFINFKISFVQTYCTNLISP